MDEKIYLDYLDLINQNKPNISLTHLKKLLEGKGYKLDEQEFFHYIDQLNGSGFIEKRPFDCNITLSGLDAIRKKSIFKEDNNIGGVSFYGDINQSQLVTASTVHDSLLDSRPTLNPTKADNDIATKIITAVTILFTSHPIKSIIAMLVLISLSCWKMRDIILLILSEFK